MLLLCVHVIMQFIVCLQFMHTSIIVRHSQIQSCVCVGGTDISILLLCVHIKVKLMLCVQFTHTWIIVRHIQIQACVWVAGTDIFVYDCVAMYL